MTDALFGRVVSVEKTSSATCILLGIYASVESVILMILTCIQCNGTWKDIGVEEE